MFAIEEALKIIEERMKGGQVKDDDVCVYSHATKTKNVRKRKAKNLPEDVEMDNEGET